MTVEVLTTIIAQQTADLQRVASQLGADFVPYAKRIEDGIFDILKPYEDKNITATRQDKILKEINELTRAEYTAYNKYLDTQMKLVSTEEVAVGVMAIDTAIESDVDINEPKKSDVSAAIIATPIQQGDKSWTTYKGSQDSFKNAYISEIQSAALASFQGAATGKEVADAMYSQIHYQGRKASKSVLDRSRRSANSLSATLTNHTANVSRVQFGEANSKLIKGYVFIAVIDSQTSQTCRQGDQTTMKADNPKFSAWSAPRHRGCRSALSYDVDERYRLDDSDTKRQSSFTKDGLRDPKQVSSAEMYYQQMLDANLSADDMNKIMGVSLGKAFRKGIKDGTLTPESFAKLTVDSLYQPLTVAQMSARNNALGDILRKQSGSKKKLKKVSGTEKKVAPSGRMDVPTNKPEVAVGNIKSTFKNADVQVLAKLKKSEVYKRNVNALDSLQSDYYIGSNYDEVHFFGFNGNLTQKGARSKQKRFKDGTGGAVVTGVSSRQLNVNSKYLTKEGIDDFYSGSVKFIDRDNFDISTLTHEFGHLIFTPTINLKGINDARQLAAMTAMRNEWEAFTHTDLYREWKSIAGKGGLGSSGIAGEFRSRFDLEKRAATAKYKAGDITYDQYKEEWTKAQLSVEKALQSENERTFVSMYGYYSDNELIAESFASYKLSDNPPEIARVIGEMIDRNMRR